MDKEMKFYKGLLGLLLGIFALYVGKMFWGYFIFSFGTIVSFLVIPVMLGYIYIAIGLARLKKWAYTMFFTIVMLALLVEMLLVLTGDSISNMGESIFHLIFWVSLVAVPVFGISALIRKTRERNRT